ncbi:MAG: pyrroline-5-carboxylate reductase, partial [Planctomycetota bacterium]|nr:pyrroline-5-carboxylate reductase [Planctomycetota bacterium]
MVRVGIIGAGELGSTMARTLAEKYSVTVSRREIEKVRDLKERGVILTTDNREVAQRSDVVFVAVKPSKVIEVLRKVGDVLRGKLLISVAAAIPLRRLKEAIGGERVVRAMPNIAVMVRAGFTAYTASDNLAEEDIKLTEQLLSEFGICMRVEEELMDAVTALSGSGPAYVATLIEAMAYAGLKVGLPREFAYKSSAYTVFGSAKLYLETGLHPAVIKEMVLTPAGTTIEGIFHLEESGIRTA